MRSAGRDTIATRITRINLLVSAFSLVLACSGFVVYDQVTVRNAIANDLASQARIIAANSASAIMFDDTAAATATLAPVRDIPNVLAAEIRLPSGTLFARYSRSGTDSLSKFAFDPNNGEMHWSADDQIMYGRQIKVGGRVVGAVLISSDLSPVQERLWQYLGIAFIVFAIAFAAAIAASRSLRTIISSPIERLAAAARKVTSQRDFGVRVVPALSIGELILLTAAFNEMLAQLQRDEDERKNTEMALIQSEKLAATGRMAATMAHEINNPLESVTNLLFLANKDATLSSKSRRYLKLAEQELDRVAHLCKQTLGFYRDSSSASKFNVSEEVDEVLTIYARRIASRNITVEKDLCPNSEVYGFVGEFRQVLSNLLVNAIDAMSDAGGRLIVKTHRLSELVHGRSGVKVVVADTGHGISQANRTKIFDAFFTTKQNLGTGLGLWLTRGIVEKHGGKIRVRSRVDQPSTGTVFSVSWPSIDMQGCADHVPPKDGAA